MRPQITAAPSESFECPQSIDQNFGRTIHGVEIHRSEYDSEVIVSACKHRGKRASRSGKRAGRCVVAVERRERHVQLLPAQLPLGLFGE